MTTEIYSCKEGQALKEGKLDYSSDIDTKEAAEEDAKRRCQRDPSLKKIAYYKVALDGEFRVFYSYTNPNCKAQSPKPALNKATVNRPKPKAKAKPPEKTGLLARLKKTLGI